MGENFELWRTFSQISFQSIPSLINAFSERNVFHPHKIFNKHTTLSPYLGDQESLFLNFLRLRVKSKYEEIKVERKSIAFLCINTFKLPRLSARKRSCFSPRGISLLGFRLNLSNTNSVEFLLSNHGKILPSSLW
ncbi:hypothetical protein CEXT_333671 [Caerostris extrusa]|uniref:Ribosomal protein S14 n=1 Tax=Caerostris extrusa TaxID=172846 RepID=A0AAV4XZV0_CAEEX|nr:hypothetical protein CEXT_333671 [Caerostris extrusa]